MEWSDRHYAISCRSNGHAMCSLGSLISLFYRMYCTMMDNDLFLSWEIDFWLTKNCPLRASKPRRLAPLESYIGNEIDITILRSSGTKHTPGEKFSPNRFRQAIWRMYITRRLKGTLVFKTFPIIGKSLIIYSKAHSTIWVRVLSSWSLIYSSV